MADSLFDNRYRYDYIYPRGRSGETLRAADTAQHDRPVVIKRPAPNDAPPIRAGQEVSILNERKALMRLSGHPVLTEFLDGGQFFVGGMAHQYIVMERAEGLIVADAVLELARQGERLPHLEMLVVVDALLDLLQTAHARDIVYNDVDAKHLFWNRETYQLKVIDWGNAVFLEGDEITPQGISRQTDVFQVGELLYFILSGGGRADIPRDAGDAFRLDFGEDNERISLTLQAIVSKAAHPNTRLRYPSISDLRRDLARYRAPYERERDSVVNHVIDRLRYDLSKNDLRGLLNMLDPALAIDPGHPAARKARADVESRLRDLGVAADLDAVRIYMNGGNWSRAADLLAELRERAGDQTAALLDLLMDCAEHLIDARLPTTPQAITDGLNLIFDGKMVHAAQVLLTSDAADGDTRKTQWLLAERISSHYPEVLLLRPNLYRLEMALGAVEVDGVNISDGRHLLSEIQQMLTELDSGTGQRIAQIRDAYRAIVDRLSTLNKLLSTVMVQQRLPNRKLPLSSLDRALNAAMALADNVHIIGRQGAVSPRDALMALDTCRAIDPTNPLWQSIFNMLNGLYEKLQTYQTYVPAADGSDIATWLSETSATLKPYLDHLFDELLVEMVDGLEVAGQSWVDYSDSVVAGNRKEAIANLTRAAEAVNTVSPTLSGWLNQLRAVVDGANYVERHAVFGGLGRALADGWEAFDRGRLGDAERLGQHALEIARSETGREVAQRLLTLSSTAREWIERSGVLNAKRTQAALETIENLYTPAERRARDNFASQMPSRETYLRAMRKGLVDYYARTSSAGMRLFYVNSVLLGALEAHDQNLPDAQFWQDVAGQALDEHGLRHPATRTLSEFIERRQSINVAAERINKLVGVGAFDQLETTRRTLEENSQAKVLAAAVHSLRELELAVRDWSDGEFRTAGLKLENAINSVSEAEQAADTTLTPYRGWLVELQSAAAELHTQARQMRQMIERRPTEPAPLLENTHRTQADLTAQKLGAKHAAQLRQWYETYQAFASAYTDKSLRRSAKLERFNTLFKAMFIDRHPAYPLYRYWYDVVDNAPEFPAPPTDDPTPRIDEAVIVAVDEYTPAMPQQADTEALDADTDYPAYAGRGGGGGRRGLPFRVLLVVGAITLVTVIILLLVSGQGTSPGDVPVTISATPDSSATFAVALRSTENAEGTQAVMAQAATNRAATSAAREAAESDTPEPTDAVQGVAADLATPTLVTPTRLAPSPTDTPLPEPTETPTPSDTPTPTETPIPTQTFTPTPTETPTLPPNGIQGTQDIFTLLQRMTTEGYDYPWQPEQFSMATGGAAWRFGMGQQVSDGEMTISLAPETLDQFYGSNAPARIRQTDATLSLVTYDPPLLNSNDVYFGLMLQSADDSTVKAGLYIQVVGLNAVNLWLREGDQTTFETQRSVNTVIARVRLERDAATGDVLVFFNDAQVGAPIPFASPDAPVYPVLFIKDGGVIVNVSNWRVTLR